MGGGSALLLGFIALCFAVSASGVKAQANAGMKIASVDKGRLFDEYNYTKNANLTLQKMRENAELTLQTWAQNSLLPEADQTRLSDLAVEQKAVGEGKLDAGKKTEMDKLVKKSAEDNNDFVTLQGAQNPTPTQQMRLGVLTRAYSDTQARIESKKRAVSAEIDKTLSDNQIQIFKDMRAAIAQVAKAKGFNVVLTNDIAMFCDNDITDAVLANMNGKK